MKWELPMLKEDIQPGYAPKEITFAGYTTHNLHHSADAAKAFQSTIQRAYQGQIKRPDLIRDALVHTDQYMGINDAHLEQGKAPDKKDLAMWRHAHTQAQKDLEEMGEFMHHEDYWHMHGHEIEAMEGNYNPGTAGFDAIDLASSYTPSGAIISEAAKVCPVATHDLKVNLANRQTAIEEYHYGPADPKNPGKYFEEVAVRWDIDVKQAKGMLCGNCAAFDVSDDMRACIKEGIQGKDPEITDSQATIDQADLGYCTLLKFKCAGTRTCAAWLTNGPITEETNVSDIKEELTDKTIRSNDKIKVARVIADMLGIEKAESMAPEAAVNLGLRKLKTKRMTPEYIGTVKKMIKLAQEVGIKVDPNVIPTAVHEAKDSPVVDKNSKYNIAKGVLRFNDFLKLSKLNNGVVPVDASFSKRIGEQKGMRPEDPNSSDEGDQSDETGHTLVDKAEGSQGTDQVRRMKVRYRTEEVQMEDLESADFKTSASGHKYRARHIEFKNSGRDATMNQDEDQEQPKRQVKTTKPLLKKIGEETESKDDYEFSEKELNDLAASVDTEEDVMDVYDDNEFEVIDTETGEEVEEGKEDIKEDVLNEVMSRQARMRARVKFAQTKGKRARRLQIALKTHSSPQKINHRARTLAIKLMKQRIMKKPVAQLSIAEKERVEKMISKRKAAVDRLAMKLVPRIRKIEQARFAHKKFTKSAPSAGM